MERRRLARRREGGRPRGRQGRRQLHRRERPTPQDEARRTGAVCARRRGGERIVLTIPREMVEDSPTVNGDVDEDAIAAHYGIADTTVDNPPEFVDSETVAQRVATSRIEPTERDPRVAGLLGDRYDDTVVERGGETALGAGRLGAVGWFPLAAGGPRAPEPGHRPHRGEQRVRSVDSSSNSNVTAHQVRIRVLEALVPLERGGQAMDAPLAADPGHLQRLPPDGHVRKVRSARRHRPPRRRHPTARPISSRRSALAGRPPIAFEQLLGPELGIRTDAEQLGGELRRLDRPPFGRRGGGARRRRRSAGRPTGSAGRRPGPRSRRRRLRRGVSRQGLKQRDERGRPLERGGLVGHAHLERPELGMGSRVPPEARVAVARPAATKRSTNAPSPRTRRGRRRALTGSCAEDLGPVRREAGLLARR